MQTVYDDAALVSEWGASLDGDALLRSFTYTGPVSVIEGALRLDGLTPDIDSPWEASTLEDLLVAGAELDAGRYGAIGRRRIRVTIEVLDEEGGS